MSTMSGQQKCCCGVLLWIVLKRCQHIAGQLLQNTKQMEKHMPVQDLT